MSKRVVFMAVFMAASISMLAGCSDPTPARNDVLKPESQTGRMNVTSAQVIRDARGYRRDILVMRDTETGMDYIAIMGAGVTEMRTQSNGKTTYQVEE